jgi:glycosyltransferase involved in cell wall biosynthesis
MDYSSIYLADDFKRANSVLYGAQEMDTWAGVRLFSSRHEVWRLSVSPNNGELQLTDPCGNKIVSGFFTMANKYGDRNYWRTLFSYFDPSLAQYGLSQIREFFQQVNNDFTFDIWWAETQFYDAVMPKERIIITRSVNFEPTHVMGEDPSMFRYIRKFLKMASEKRVSQSGVVIPISPLDSIRYSRLNIQCGPVIPLRQLAFLNTEEKSTPEVSDYFVMAGSSFDIRHNKRNLEFILNKIAPILLVLEPKIKIKIFGSRIPINLKPANNVEMLGFREDYQDQLKNSLGTIVPFHGGAGMQSKVFEPLALGVPLIANPKSLVGYPFLPNVHYLPATNEFEYVNQMVALAENVALRKTLTANSISLSIKLFNKQVLMQKIHEIHARALN